MFFATQGGCWVYFALHQGLLPPSECIPLHKCLPLYPYVTFQPIAPLHLSQIQTPHPHGESATPSTTLIIPSATHTATPGGLSPPLSLPRGPVPPSLSSSTIAGCSIPRSNTNPLSQIQTPHPQGECATPSTTLIIPSATHTATPGGLLAQGY